MWRCNIEWRSTSVRLGRCLAGSLLLLLFAAFLCVGSGCKKGTFVRGRVTNASSGDPVTGAKVTVRFERLDNNYNWVDAGHAQLTSGVGGEFSIENPYLGGRFVVLAEREGFYPNQDCRVNRRLERHALRMDYAVEVRLFPVIAPKRLPKGQGEVRVVVPGQRIGWSFAASQMAPETVADFVGEPDEAGRKIAALVACRHGGFSRAAGLSGEWALFNMPEAPRDGYETRVDLRAVGEDERRCYYVRTSDGQHYAKIDMGGDVYSREFCGIRFSWVYQPDGTRVLEIPFEESAK